MLYLFICWVNHLLSSSEPAGLLGDMDNINKMYKQLVELALDHALNATTPSELAESINNLRKLGDGLTYNAVLRCQEDKH